MANVMRYNYLRGPGGKFRNPYDHGVHKNCSDFLIKGYNEDIEVEEQSLNSVEMSMIQMTNAVSQNGQKQSDLANGNGHVSIDIDVDSKGPSRTHGHVHTPKCSHSKSSITSSSKGFRIPFGLGLGLGRNNARHSTRSVLAT